MLLEVQLGMGMNLVAGIDEFGRSTIDVCNHLGLQFRYLLGVERHVLRLVVGARTTSTHRAEP